MPDKLTDSEIVKALECCKYEYDTKCELCCYNFYSRTGCRSELRRNALDLINRLQAENERLKDYNENLLTANTSLSNEILDAKTEAYKESIEKVKEKLRDIAKIDWQDNYYYLIGEAFFDNLLKELVGEDK